MIPEIKGRPLTCAFVVGAGISSAVFNIYGAYHLFVGFAAIVFAAFVFFIEGVAILALKHIVEDASNNNYFKASLGALIFSLAVIGCAMSGKHAFNRLTIDIDETIKSERAKIERMQTHTDSLFALAKEPGITANAVARRQGAAEISQGRVDALRIEVAKKAPPAEWLVYLLLAIAELVKSSGRYALATQSAKQWSWRQRRIQREKEKAKLRELRDNNVIQHPSAA